MDVHLDLDHDSDHHLCCDHPHDHQKFDQWNDHEYDRPHAINSVRALAPDLDRE